MKSKFGFLLLVPSILMAMTVAPALGAPSQLVPFSTEVFEFSLVTGEEGSLGECVAGDFDGDERPDLAVLVGSTPVVLFGPAIYKASKLVDGSGNLAASGLAVLPPISKGERLVTGGPAGVHVWTYDPGTGVFDSVEVSRFVSRAVVAVDLEGDGAQELVALSTSAAEIAVIRPADQTEVTWTLAGETASALAPVDWLGDGTRQVALLVPQGVQVRDASGVLIAEVLHAGGSLDLAALRLLGDTTDHLLWVDEISLQGLQPHQRLHWISAYTGLQTLDLGPRGVIGIAAADLDQDRQPEVLLALEDQCAVMGLWASIQAPILDITDSFVLESPEPGHDCSTRGPRVRPVPVDLDNDSSVDVVFSLDGGNLFAMSRNLLDPQRETVAPDPCVHTELTHPVAHLELDFPVEPSEQYAVDVLVFKASGVPAGEIGGIDPVAWAQVVQSVTEANSTVSFPLDTTGEEPRYYIVTRRVEPGGSHGPDTVHFFEPGQPGNCRNTGRTVEGLVPRTEIVFPEEDPPRSGT